MKLINGWNAFNKQWDKFELTLRIGFLTILDIKIDISRGLYYVMLLNFGIKL